jgi:co-chaperonin GroES (HSP10)
MITPLRDNILLEVIEEESKTAAGLYMVEQVDTKIKKARVVRCGTGVKHQYFVPQRNGITTTIASPDPDTHVFYVNVGNTPPDEVEQYMTKVRDAVKESKMEAGTVVLYDSYGAHEALDSDGKKYVLASERSLIAVLS